jgi:hypothetical protein
MVIKIHPEAEIDFTAIAGPITALSRGHLVKELNTRIQHLKKRRFTFKFILATTISATIGCSTLTGCICSQTNKQKTDCSLAVSISMMITIIIGSIINLIGYWVEHDGSKEFYIRRIQDIIHRLDISSPDSLADNEDFMEATNFLTLKAIMNLLFSMNQKQIRNFFNDHNNQKLIRDLSNIKPSSSLSSDSPIWLFAREYIEQHTDSFPEYNLAALDSYVQSQQIWSAVKQVFKRVDPDRVITLSIV